jgi:hypothetical protein
VLHDQVSGKWNVGICGGKEERTGFGIKQQVAQHSTQQQQQETQQPATGAPGRKQQAASTHGEMKK